MLLLLMGVANLSTLLVLETDLLRNTPMFIVRHCLMVLSGLGFLFLLRWGAVVFFTSVLINWVAYFTIYEGTGSFAPLWWTIPIPLLVAAACYFAWDRMSWSFRRNSEEGDA